jgi:hypothetical protein
MFPFLGARVKETTGLMLSGDLRKINRSNTRFREAVTDEAISEPLRPFKSATRTIRQRKFQDPRFFASGIFLLDLTLKIWDLFPKL